MRAANLRSIIGHGALLALTAAVTACNAPQKHDDGADGGPNAGYCIDTRTEVSFSEQTALGLTAGHLLALGAGKHVKQLTWADSSTSSVTLTVDGTAASGWFVKSEHNPATGIVPEVECRDSIEVVVAATLATLDGKLDEKWTGLVLAFQPTEQFVPDGGWKEGWLDGSAELEEGSAGGTYKPVVPAGSCLLDTFVAVHLKPGLVGQPLFTGAVQKTVAAAPCKQFDPATTAVEPVLDAEW